MISSSMSEAAMTSNLDERYFPLLWFWIVADPCEGGSCVEVASAGDGVAIRDSKDKDGPMLRFTDQEWTAFLDGAKAGNFDHLP
jgi:hypothetical protein